MKHLKDLSLIPFLLVLVGNVSWANSESDDLNRRTVDMASYLQQLIDQASGGSSRPCENNQVPSSNLLLAGGESSGGGDATELEFATIGKELVSALKKKGASNTDLERLQKAVSETHIHMIRRNLYKSNVERDALNFPVEKRILVNRDHWIALRPEQKVALAFHEYLGIAGIERDEYTVSRDLFSNLGVEEVRKIASSSAPVLNYHCIIKKTNADHAVKQDVCGEADLSTRADNFSTYLHSCGRIYISMVKFDSLGYGVHVELAQLKDGDESTWRKRSPDTYSSFEVDNYTAPNSFAISLGVREGSWFNRHTEQYWASCTKR